MGVKGSRAVPSIWLVMRWCKLEQAPSQGQPRPLSDEELDGCEHNELIPPHSADLHLYRLPMRVGVHIRTFLERKAVWWTEAGGRDLTLQTASAHTRLSKLMSMEHLHILLQDALGICIWDPRPRLQAGPQAGWEWFDWWQWIYQRTGQLRQNRVWYRSGLASRGPTVHLDQLFQQFQVTTVAYSSVTVCSASSLLLVVVACLVGAGWAVPTVRSSVTQFLVWSKNAANWTAPTLLYCITVSRTSYDRTVSSKLRKQA